jgi:ribonuclease BN (tRNA processing enzyme)
VFPGLGSFLDSLLEQNHGAYGYLGGYLDGSGNLSELVQSEVDATEPWIRSVYKNDDEDIRVDAMGVPHGIVPALSYRVSVADKTIVFSGDQNGDNDAFIDFAEDTDILVIHMAVPEGAAGAVTAEVYTICYRHQRQHSESGKERELTFSFNAIPLC